MRHQRPPTLRIHRIIGLASGAWLALIGLTGSLLCFVETVDRATHPQMLTSPPGDTRASIDDIVAAATRTALPRTAVRVRLPRDARDVYELVTDDERHIYVDQSGRVTGHRAEGQVPREMLLRLHTALFLERKALTAIPAAALIALGVSGLRLRIPLGRSLERLRLPSASLSRNAWHLHNVTGTLALPFLLLSATTGLALIFYTPCETALNRWLATHQVPVPQTDTPLLLQTREGRIQTLVAAALHRFPQAVATWVYLPTPDRPLTRVRLKQPGEWHPHGRTTVTFDDQGRIISLENAHTAPLGTRVMNQVFPAHTLQAGLPGRLACALVGLVPALMLATGLAVFLRRRARAA